MPVSAWLMLIFGSIVLYGGFIWCLMIAIKSEDIESEDESGG